MGLRILLLAVALASVECLDRARLQKCPPPQKDFDAGRYIGDWYILARLPPCSWSGSSEFNNFLSQYSVQPSGNIHLKDTWRNGVCASATFVLKPELPNGVYTLKDPIGDVITGKSVVVATDYKTFAIKWGCSKFMGEICADAYVVVKTKQKKPSPKTLEIAESICDQYWGISVSEMIMITHDHNACTQFGPAGHPAGPAIQPSLLKTY